MSRSVRLAILSVAFLPLVALPARAAEFTAATYNINFGNVDLRETVAVIRKAKADVVALQETNSVSESYLRRALAREYSYSAFRGDRGRYAAERFGFLSKSRVVNLRYLPAKHGAFGVWIGEVELGGRSVQLVNVHLQPVVFEQGGGLRGMLGAFDRTESIHKQEIAYIADNVPFNQPTLILGDFNSMSAMAAPKFLAEKGLVDSFAAVTKDPDTHRTWHWPVGQAELSARIDYLFHTKELETLDSRIVPSASSDHYLLVSRLQWKRPSTGP